ncbi:MAG: Maf family protein [Alphaproteobacteria bacterium]|nr:Maf family protein [Alphaproteobacteria bacterium]
MSGIILASGSLTRQRLLRAAGVVFEVDAPAIDETGVLEALQAEGASARDAADLLAELKALKTASRHLKDWVIGGDQILSLGAEFFSKPGTLGGARTQLQSLRGKTHELSSAVCVAKDGVIVWRYVGQAKLSMRQFSDEFLDAYLVDATADILGSVGAYHVEGLGLQLFSKIEGEYFTILGLPMLPLLDFLRVNGALKT